MPTIEIRKTDFDKFLKPIIEEQGRGREETLSRIKGEIKGEDNDCYKIEIADTNRPDLFTVEGIARELLGIFKEEKFKDDFLNESPKYKIEVLESVREVRPFVGALVVRNLTVDEDTLHSLISIQEKLGETLGKRRKRVAIGVYEAGSIEFPVRYGAFDPQSYKFVPLEFSEEMTLDEVLRKHPKGIEYGHLLKGCQGYPLLLDANRRVLSLPPIVNSREMGEVRPGANHLFVEATGTDQKAVILALNIISSALSLRGGTIERCETVYPYATPLGENQVTPRQMNKALRVDMEELKQLLGIDISRQEAADCLRRLGYEIQGQGEKFQALAPYYRSDGMHEHDIIEDIAIVKGYENFSPLPLSDFTIGGLSREQEIVDKVREILVGMGFQEIISNALVNRRELSQRMRCETEAIEVDNVMTETYSVLRSWLIPCLLKVERESSQVEYPHKVFEVGEVVVKENGPREEIRLAVLISSGEFGFTDIHRILESLMEELSYPYHLKEACHSSFIEGRFGEIESGHKSVGIIGEVHPEVLSNWAVKMPVSAFELRIYPY
ncbi:MAG: phenylalanine--tRNA ligase subunit beta [Nitrospirae bacterium]|nr:phenylalanine--tRNA ligase subunit beta [Nitrospirota bacterium]